ncbi:MAG: hemin uptake protein HemP [Gemmataceae bacterium]
MATNADDRRGEKTKETAPGPALSSRQLFGGAKEILIEHEGARYRLRITRRNKLILQK